MTVAVAVAAAVAVAVAVAVAAAEAGAEAVVVAVALAGSLVGSVLVCPVCLLILRGQPETTAEIHSYSFPYFWMVGMVGLDRFR